MACLTKSKFLSSLQCHKRLWFETHQPADSPASPSVAMLQGRAFDAAVRDLHPGVLVSLDGGLQTAIEETSRLILQGASGPPRLYQAAFRAGSCAVISDVLQRHGTDYDLIEVKSSTGVKDIHLPDVAFQAWVLMNADLPLKSVFIGHVNNRFVLHENGRYEGLLVEEDVTDQVLRSIPEIGKAAASAQDVMASTSMPSIAAGAHCTVPYECPFLERCHSPSRGAVLFPITGLPKGGKLIDELIAAGYDDLREVPEGRLSLEMHRRVHAATVTSVPYFDKTAACELEDLPYPLSYLDFETISFAVPEVIGTRPYEQLPFQWSIHVEQSPENISHHEFIAIETFADFDALSVGLIAALPPAGAIFAYNASFEMRVLLRLAELAPSHAKTLRDIAARLVDLLPITRAAYYHREMRGSWSIKSVMPTIDPSLRYETLGDVRDGGGAQEAFMQLRSGQLSPDETTRLREAPLAYRQHDTWVMVILRRFLCGKYLQTLITPRASPN